MQHRTSSRAAADAPLRFRGDIDLAGDGGYIAAMTALLIIPLMAFVAFAVDLGAWYSQSTKLQRAVDQAAMAGVVWLPNTGAANAEAQAALQRNGFSSANATVSFQAISGTAYQVSAAQIAPRFFSNAFGLDDFTITRMAIAEFNKPIPLGSPTTKFGNDLNPTNNPTPPTCPQYQPSQASPCGPQSMLWSAIQGPFETFANGDPYATKCARNGASGSAANCNDPTTPNGAKNELYRKTGYNFAVDVPQSAVGVPQTIWVWDGGHYGRSTNSGSTATNVDCNRFASPWGAATGNNFPSGFGAQNCQAGDSGSGINTELQLWNNDGSDLTVQYTTTVAGCRLYVPSSAPVATYKNKWASICTFTPTQKGIYPLRVKTSDIAGVTDAGTGYNAFSMKVTAPGATSRLYALDDMSIWTNTPGSSARFYLAEIGPEHKGKKLQLDLYDPGDGAGNTQFKMQLLAPPSGVPTMPPTGGSVIPAANIATSCNYNATPSATKGPTTPNTASTCEIITKNSGTSGAGIYNNSWLRIEVAISPNYSCTTDCWWTIKYDFGGSGTPTDRTVWSLNVVGDPVHLIQ